MKAFVGVTDDDWCRFLAGRPELTEVNFWRPSGRGGFHVLTAGKPLTVLIEFRSDDSPH